MAEKRKLLNEIEKCYKKIEEGFEIFDDIMNKMNEANSDNQREKFQDDLKKEIKKLQRLRDQIKGWQNSSDIKDKDSLTKFRKLIENRMELFKEVERENKTKPHSKQGLSIEDKLDPKEKEKMDTIEWLNCQIRRIQDEIDRTESKLETLTSTADTSRKRGGKKDDSKKNDKEKVEELRKHLERVKFHLTNLEVCMRLINNEKLEIKDVLEKLKEPVEMYIDALDPDNDDDPESMDPEDIYEELNFGTYISQLGGMTMGSLDDDKTQSTENCKSPCASPTPMSESVSSQRHQSGETETSSTRTPLSSIATANRSSSIVGGMTPLKLTRLGSQISAETASPLPLTPPAMPGIPYNSVAAGKLHTPPVVAASSVIQQLHRTAASVTPPLLLQQTMPLQSSSTDSSGSTSHSSTSYTNTASGTTGTTVTADTTNTSATTTPSSFLTTSTASPATVSTNTTSGAHTGSSQTPSDTFSSQRNPSGETDSRSARSPLSSANRSSSVGVGGLTSQEPVRFASQLNAETSSPLPQTPPTTPSIIPYNSAAADNMQQTPPVVVPVAATVTPPLLLQQQMLSQQSDSTDNSSVASQSSSSYPNTISGTGTTVSTAIADDQQQIFDVPTSTASPATVSTNAGTTPGPTQSTVIPPWLGASPLGMVPIQGELEQQLNALESALPKVPVQMDSEKQRTYLQKMPCQTPAYYPQAPLPNADSLEYYLRLSVETLFFIFYYMEGSRAQLLAAKALKKLSWRFHTKYLMWFQRHEEPKQITDDYEQGTYVYFDFEKWVQRKKENFTFEYKYLEDKDFN